VESFSISKVARVEHPKSRTQYLWNMEGRKILGVYKAHSTERRSDETVVHVTLEPLSEFRRTALSDFFNRKVGTGGPKLIHFAAK
jgi:hypothetical protein